MYMTMIFTRSYLLAACSPTAACGGIVRSLPRKEATALPNCRSLRHTRVYSSLASPVRDMLSGITNGSPPNIHHGGHHAPILTILHTRVLFVTSLSPNRRRWRSSESPEKPYVNID